MTDAIAIVFVLINFNAVVERTHVRGWVGSDSLVSHFIKLHLTQGKSTSVCSGADSTLTLSRQSGVIGPHVSPKPPKISTSTG